ncbi:MAG: nucleoside diphosphate kinase regulator [Deltaproteobacteria bacterium]|nr:nucleoside diphosphate kinase regulator [Deltaproteobacteria bacterium]MCW5802120.1 nucleoside diphosphate kinase regulator [Deltaproteobacteria bacterium]
MPSPPILVSVEDRDRLRRLIEHTTAATVESLEDELERARVLPSSDVPANVVVMNSEIEYEDITTGYRRRVWLVYPGDASTHDNKISVLAPLGCALLGLQVGQEIDWKMPGGVRRLRVLSVTPPRDLPRDPTRDPTTPPL